RKPQKRYVLNSHPELASADWEAIAKHPNINLFPPAQYDHPYKGARLNIVEVHTQEEVHSGCKVSYAPVPYILGCVPHDERYKSPSEPAHDPFERRSASLRSFSGSNTHRETWR